MFLYNVINRKARCSRNLCHSFARFGSRICSVYICFAHQNLGVHANAQSTISLAYGVVDPLEGDLGPLEASLTGSIAGVGDGGTTLVIPFEEEIQVDGQGTTISATCLPFRSVCFLPVPLTNFLGSTVTAVQDATHVSIGIYETQASLTYSAQIECSLDGEGHADCTEGYQEQDPKSFAGGFFQASGSARFIAVAVEPTGVATASSGSGSSSAESGGTSVTGSSVGTSTLSSPSNQAQTSRAHAVASGWSWLFIALPSLVGGIAIGI